MAHKFIDWVLTIFFWLLALAIVIGIIVLFIQPIVVWTDKSEMRLYVRFALLLMAVAVFGILRLYNSIVQNTRFLVKVHSDIAKLLAELPNLQRALNLLAGKADALRGTANTTARVLGNLSDEARELITILKQNSNGASKNSH